MNRSGRRPGNGTQVLLAPPSLYSPTNAAAMDDDASPFGSRPTGLQLRTLSAAGFVEPPDSRVIGTSQLFDAESKARRFVPTPTPDPKDPLNLPQCRKWAAVAALCFFGALANAGEAIIGALLPVFVLEYAGLDPKLLGSLDLAGLGQPWTTLDPLHAVEGLAVRGPRLWKVALLASLPLLVNGVASFVMVPLSIAVGRRPVLLIAGALAWIGGLAAGFSNSLTSHLVARCFQAVGAGAVDGVVPLVLQDMLFIHERNRALAAVAASSGFLITGLGISAPVIVLRMHWRYIYWITAAAAVAAWAAVIALVPETRWLRTAEELAGKDIYTLRPGETRPRLDYACFGPRTLRTDYGLLHVSREWRRAGRSVVDTLRTTLFPAVAWAILVNTCLAAAQRAVGQVTTAVLIGAGWDFETLGLAVVPLVIAAPLVWLLGGWGADWVANTHARRNGGRREPEAHLLSLVVPLLAGVAGPLTFGYAAQNLAALPAWIVLVGVFLIGFANATVSTIFSVFLIESFPAYAGPVLVTVSTWRLIAGFAMTFNVTRWVHDLGFLTAYGGYSAALGGAGLLLPLVYVFGKRMRAWAVGRLEPTMVKEVEA